MSIEQVILWIVSVAVALCVVAAVISERTMVRPGRTPLWINLKELWGIDYEDVVFSATDGAQLIYSISGGPKLSHIQPRLRLRGVINTPTLDVESRVIHEGSVQNVQRKIDATSNAQGLFPETTHRFDGYRYTVARPDISPEFFTRYTDALTIN